MFLENFRNRYSFNLLVFVGLCYFIAFIGYLLFILISPTMIFYMLLVLFNFFLKFSGLMFLLSTSMLIFEYTLDIKIKNEKFINSKTFPWVQGVGIVSFFTPAIVAGLIYMARN